MKLLRYHESRPRGSGEFPLEYHHVDESHPRYQMPCHWHEEAEMLHVISGTFELTLDDASLTLGAEDVAFIAPERLHGGVAQGCVYECIVFDLRLLLKCGDPCRQQVSRVLHQGVSVKAHHPSGGSASTFVPQMMQALREKSPGCELIALGGLYRFIGEAFRAGGVETGTEQSGRRVMKLKRVFEMIETQYAQPITLADMAAAAHMSPRYFCRLFRAVTHRTPVDYLNAYRIGVACDEIAGGSGERTLTEIALDAGFSSLNYFIRQFRRHKGVTPGQYQAMMRQTVGAVDAFAGCNSCQDAV